MSIESECIVCIMRQALDVCDFVGANESAKQSALRRVMQILISGTDEDPTEGINYLVHEELKKLTNNTDPYKNIKDESIRKALEIYPWMISLVEKSDEQLKTAVELCIAGNVIDFGPSNIYDIEASIDEVLHSRKQHFDFNSFQDEINRSKTILILGDNAGETVFDLILMHMMNHQVFYVVKSKPILNDAVMEDAINSGISQAATIVENGSPMPGTFLPRCSQDFLDLFYSTDMVISKGQANFETLVNEERRIFFLFKVKCKLLSRKHDLLLGEYVLLDNKSLKTIN
jgi:damage-control phosphatase, subfamily I